MVFHTLYPKPHTPYPVPHTPYPGTMYLVHAFRGTGVRLQSFSLHHRPFTVMEFTLSLWPRNPEDYLNIHPPILPVVACANVTLRLHRHYVDITLD